MNFNLNIYTNFSIDKLLNILNLMKKLVLFLFIVPLIYSCNEDSSNDDVTNNQTFLEEYGGVIWQDTTNDPSDPENFFYSVFTNDGITTYETSGNMSGCEIDEIIWGQSDSDGMVVTITEDSQDLLVLQISQNGLTATWTLTPDDSGNILNSTSSIPGEDDESWIRVSSLPCN